MGSKTCPFKIHGWKMEHFLSTWSLLRGTKLGFAWSMRRKKDAKNTLPNWWFEVI